MHVLKKIITPVLIGVSLLSGFAVAGSVDAAPVRTSTPAAPHYTLGCGRACGDETATARFDACNSTKLAARYYLYRNGALVKSYDVASNTCKTRRIAVVEGDVAVSKACYLTRLHGRCVSPRKQVGGTHHIIVPGTVSMQLNGDYSDPLSYHYTATFTVPSGLSYYTIELVRPDGNRIPLSTDEITSSSLQLGNGGTVVATYTVDSTETYDFVLRAYEDSAYSVLSTCDPAFETALL